MGRDEVTLPRAWSCLTLSLTPLFMYFFMQQMKREFNPTVLVMHLLVQRHLAVHCTFFTWIIHLGSLNCVFKVLPSLDSHEIGVHFLSIISRATLL